MRDVKQSDCLLIIITRESCGFENLRKTYSHLFMLLQKKSSFSKWSAFISSRLVPFISVIWSVSSREPCALLSALLQRCSARLWIICSLSPSVCFSNEQKWDTPARLSFHPFILLYVSRADTRACESGPLRFLWARGAETHVYCQVKGSFNARSMKFVIH